MYVCTCTYVRVHIHMYDMYMHACTVCICTYDYPLWMKVRIPPSEYVCMYVNIHAYIYICAVQIHAYSV